MRHTQRLFMLYILLLLIFLQVSCSIRFSYLGSRYDGTFGEEVGVSSAGECTLLAFNKKKIGYRVKVDEGKKTCALLTTFKRFTTLSDNNIRDYILTTSVSDQVCTVNTSKNVTQFISGRCTPDRWDCKLLEKMKDYCIFVGSDKPDCISSTGVSMEKVECPKGQHRVAVKKGTLLCCREGETFAEERNRKAYCCPPNKKLKGIFKEKSICCNPSDNYKTGTSFCCPTGKQFSSGSGLERCCASGLVPSKSSSGSIGCCPSGEEFAKREGGVDYCCPQGTTFYEVKSGKSSCCANGYILKGYNNGVPQCCLVDSNYDSASGTCCPNGWFSQRNGNDVECCYSDWKLKRAPNGKVRCCPNDNPNAVLADDGSLQCCPLAYTRAELTSAGGYLCTA